MSVEWAPTRTRESTPASELVPKALELQQHQAIFGASQAPLDLDESLQAQHQNSTPCRCNVLLRARGEVDAVDYEPLVRHGLSLAAHAQPKTG